MDRLAPTRRPPGRAAMRQRWAELLFLHWPLPAEVLSARLPAGLELDTFEDTAYVGLVPFTMTGVRPAWAPAVPGLSSFHEVNLRTYVHRAGRDPGVFFFSLDAANPVAVLVARTLWHLPYNFARMRLARDGKSIHYASARRWPEPRGAGCSLVYEPRGTPSAAGVGTLEHFLAERYILYTEARGRLYSGRVHHVPYPLQPAVVHALDESLFAAAGLVRPPGAPLMHYAREVSVELFALERVT